MFRENIPYVDPVTSEYLATMLRPDSEPDAVLSLLGIACFKPRLKDYSGIKGKIMNCSVSEMLEYVQPHLNDPGVWFCGVSSSGTLSDKDSETLAEYGFYNKETVEQIVRQKCPQIQAVNIWYRKESNMAIVRLYPFNLDVYHFVLSFLPLYYPGIYPKPLSKDDPEVELLSAMSKPTSTLFRKTYPKLVEKYKEEFLHCTLVAMFRNFHLKEMEAAREDRDRRKRDMENIYREYEQAVKNFREAMIRVEGLALVSQNDEKENELVEYLGSNPAIQHIRINDSKISFIVATTLKRFDVDAYQKFSDNESIYDGNYKTDLRDTPFKDKACRKLLLDSIFSEDPIFEVKIVGTYTLDFVNNTMTTRSGYDYAGVDPLYADYVANPHLQIFSCLGQYKGRVQNLLTQGEQMAALEMTIASAESVDLDETEQTFRPFLGWIFTNKNKILRKDGEDMTPEAALAYLLEQKGKEE